MFRKWKEALESKGLKIYLGITKVRVEVLQRMACLKADFTHGLSVNSREQRPTHFCV